MKLSSCISKLIGSTSLSLFLACTPPPPPKPYSPPPEVTKAVEIISEPPGARIEVNNEFMGEAPLTINVRSTARGMFKENTIIRALPVRAGHYVQTKMFIDGSYVPDPAFSKIPSKIFFDMRLGTPDINLNVR